MSAQSALDNTLREILRVVQPSPKDWTTRLQIIHQLREAIESMESLRGATVEPFGSFVSNLFTIWGDLDVSIEFTNGSFVSSNGKKQKQRLLGDVMNALRQKGGWRRYQLIPNARVPILKVESNIQNVSCDISIDNLKCQVKSKLLLWISEIDTRFRDMVLLVKEWAKAHKINNPRAGTFNSYSLTLLVLFHFQTCSPAILPPLKDIYPGNIIDNLRGLRVDAERHIAETCVANIERIKRAYSMRPKNRSSLSELFVSFLGKFSDISTRASEFGICTYTGQWHAIESNTRWLPKTSYSLFIEDPFEQPENSARAVRTGELTRISGAFAMSHHRLISTDHSSFSNMPDQRSLLATLVRPQTSRLIVGPPVRNPVYNPEHRQPTHPQRFRAESSRGRTPTSNNGARKLTHPQVNPPVPSPSQVQPLLVPMLVHPRSQVQPPQAHKLVYSPSQGQPPQVHKLVHSPSQVQPQLQTTEPKRYDNRSTTGPKQLRNRSTTIKPPPQTHQDRPQQMWRPRCDTS
ncbi:protein HESO1 [Pyrus communis]|uniref:protein HESO1 n=1 Tax=Pyrus communis TaxID=23211 RepID=UPI0035C19373